MTVEVGVDGLAKAVEHGSFLLGACGHDRPDALAAIQDAAPGQALVSSGRGDEVADGGVRQPGLWAPILADKREHAMLDLIPLAGSRRQVTHAYRQTLLRGEFCIS